MKKNNSVEVEEERLQIAQSLLKKDFDFEVQNFNSREEMKKQLSAFLNILLNKDFERLLQGLYRIDVSEQKVKEILHVGSPENIADNLAELILNRQLQKATTRMQYR
ncbi:MAG: hypothetical protein ACNS60_06765 [Candidatus Cyclobacteriaceae bacterium M2_1C_046]